MKTDQETFMRYLNGALEEFAGYFINDHWLNYQTNVSILASFLNACASSGPPSSSESVWLSKTRTLSEIASSIEGRRKPGPNDSSLCRRARSAVLALRNAVPDVWEGHFPSVPEEVRNIIDKQSRYTTQAKY